MPLSIDPPVSSIDEDLNQIERGIRALKIEYEQFFGGGRKRPPNDTQWRVDSAIKRCSERMPDFSFGQRFRLNNLLQTYAKYQDMWRKKIMQKETGSQQRHFGAAAKAIAAERERARIAAQQSNSTDRVAEDRENSGPREPIFVCQLDLASDSADFDPAGTTPQHSKVEELYQHLIDARAETGERAGAPTMQDFLGFVQKKARELRAKGAHLVEYSVSIEARRVKLKARILR